MYFCVHVCYTRHLLYAVVVFLILPSRASRGRSCMTCRYLADLPLRSFCGLLTFPLASTPPGMPGTHPPNILFGGTSTGISPQYFYVLSDIADQYWLPSVRSALSRFHSAIRRHQFASVRQADSRLVPPNLELALTPLFVPVAAGCDTREVLRSATCYTHQSVCDTHTHTHRPV